MADASDFTEMVLTNPVVRDVLSRADDHGLANWYLTAGCLFQTIWNVLDGHPPTRGITDYDLFYFDASDLSWDAEDAIIRESQVVYEDCEGVVEVRNEARVHLWYEEKFGTPCVPFTSCEHAIDSFAATACCVALRSENGQLETYAPFGFDDLFNQILRPNPVLAPKSVYDTKAARWSSLWPRLTILPWP
jgi:uncharacterized protein